MDTDLQDSQESLRMLGTEASSVPLLRQALTRQGELRLAAEEAVVNLKAQLLQVGCLQINKGDFIGRVPHGSQQMFFSGSQVFRRECGEVS